MTVLDDLQALDLSAIVDAKADISVTINATDLLALVDDGAVSRILGDLGTAIQVAVDGFEEPERLFAPLMVVFADLIDEIDDEIEVDDYVQAVADAARIIAALVGMLAGEPDRIGFGGTDIGGALERVGGQFGDHAAAVSGGLSRFRALVQSVESGLPTDPAALVGPALEIVLPVPAASIDVARHWADSLLERLADFEIDPNLTSGLVNALAEVRVAAEAGDATSIEASLAALTRVRASTIDQLAAAMRQIAGVLSGLRIGDGIAPILALRSQLDAADETVFDLLDGWRQTIAGVRATLEAVDATEAMSSFEGLLDGFENEARTILETGVDAGVEGAKQWLRDLLREIPLRPLRRRLSDAIAGIADTIAGADLDAPVAAVRGVLDDLQRMLADADPAALVQAAVTELETVIRDALDDLDAALGQITAAIDAVAGEAEQVLQRAVGGLREFREVVDEITVAIENAGIVDAASRIAETLDSLQRQVSELLSKAPLPDALRETVAQLVSTLESIDLDAAIGDPLREVAAQLQLPADVATTVSDGLTAVADAIESLVPDDVIADLEAMMGDVLAEIEQLDLSQITGGVTEMLDGAAAVFEQVRVAELVGPAGEAFAEVVRVVDRLHPRVVLRPAIDLYGQILGQIPVPQPDTIVTRAGTVTSQAGEAVARAAAEPARRAVGADASMPPAGESPRGGLGPAREEPPDDLRPGDVIRLLGFLPAKLREALAGLDAGAAGDVLDGIGDRMLATARVLREVRDRVMALDAAAGRALDGILASVGPAQIDAQLALRVTAAPGIDIDASLSAVASVGPGALAADLDGERQLLADRARTVSGALVGPLAHDLDAAADLLEAIVPAGLLTDIDAMLAALDPEPIAAEFDALLADVVDAMPDFLAAADAQLRALEARVRALIDELSPGTLMQRYLEVLDVVRDELALLDPGRLADELGEIHALVRATLVAYDPIVLAGELDTTLAALVAAIRGLDPSGLMPDLSGIQAQVARVGDILPVNALAGVGTQLTAVGDELRELDVQGMLDAVNTLTPEVTEAITILIAAVRDEIVDLLESIRYTSTSGSASASFSVGVG